jgi:hypothetical protein
MAAALLALTVPAAAHAQAASAAPSDDAAKLAEAHAIIAIISPPAERDATMVTVLRQLSAQFRQSLPEDTDTDPAIKAIMDDYLNRFPELLRPVLQQDMPALLEAQALAYTHQFSLAELKDIHAFAETPTGRRYFSIAPAILGDPAVAKANSAVITDARALSHKLSDVVAEKVAAYVDAHPEVMKKLEAGAEAKGKAKTR